MRGGDYSDGEAMRRALDGVDVLFLPSAAEHPDRVSLHRSAVDAAAAAGVGRLVYTSFLAAAPDCVFTFGRDHFHTEALIRESGVGFTFLRDSIYLDYVPFFASAEGVIRGPAGDGRVAAVARDDVAACAVTALLDPQHEGRAYEVTGGRGADHGRGGGDPRPLRRPRGHATSTRRSRRRARHASRAARPTGRSRAG